MSQASGFVLFVANVSRVKLLQQHNLWMRVVLKAGINVALLRAELTGVCRPHGSFVPLICVVNTGRRDRADGTCGAKCARCPASLSTKERFLHNGAHRLEEAPQPEHSVRVVLEKSSREKCFSTRGETRAQIAGPTKMAVLHNSKECYVISLGGSISWRLMCPINTSKRWWNKSTFSINLEIQLGHVLICLYWCMEYSQTKWIVPISISIIFETPPSCRWLCSVVQSRRQLPSVGASVNMLVCREGKMAARWRAPVKVCAALKSMRTNCRDSTHGFNDLHGNVEPLDY